ncbi:hypothetical protein QXB71_002726 [Vibrio cholerae]|uniref:hypothetical protein n=1 Tax=Vibrio cholerae TaxID=666 RepID=UPI000E69E760|nr:hypothetical protein [Vibrio cholerae]EGQ8013372.1 hypothetical protein [Vibrio cholerae]EJL6679575.1 hypothetical protein [Vibrio cholerae]ELO1827489.1 hypothetical protein [Vibrio cholerae]
MSEQQLKSDNTATQQSGYYVGKIQSSTIDRKEKYWSVLVGGNPVLITGKSNCFKSETEAKAFACSKFFQDAVRELGYTGAVDAAILIGASIDWKNEHFSIVKKGSNPDKDWIAINLTEMYELSMLLCKIEALHSIFDDMRIN